MRVLIKERAEEWKNFKLLFIFFTVGTVSSYIIKIGLTEWDSVFT